tara:strand:+ start:14079 stop:14321 length:243 start_codon:yes stop_codon:yes gene_type:complete
MVLGSKMSKKEKEELEELAKVLDTLSLTTETSLNEIGIVLEHMTRTVKHLAMRLEMLEDNFYASIDEHPPEIPEDDKLIN